MKSKEKSELGTRILLAMNVLCGLALVLWLGFWLWHDRSAAGAPQSIQAPLPISMSRRAKAYLDLFDSELEQTEKDARIMASLVNNVFSNPESYRLPPQPGEYDHDDLLGLYGPTKNDGNATLLLSAAVTLSPEILHDFRLAEYLSPTFKSLIDAHSQYRSITLFTTDSLICSFPWFDYHLRVKEGLLRPDFKVTDFPYVAKAAPDQNPKGRAIWTLPSGAGSASHRVAYCSVPSYVNELYKGVVAIEFSLDQAISPLMERAQEPDELALILDGQGLILGMNSPLQIRFLQHGGGSVPGDLKGFLQRAPADIQPVLKKIASQDDALVWEAGWALKGFPVTRIPVRLLLLRPVTSATTSATLTGWNSQSLRLLCGMGLMLSLILINAVWIYRSRMRMESASRQLGQAFSALASLDLESASIPNPQGIWRDLLNEFNDSLQAIQKGLSTLPLDKSRRPPLEGDPVPISAHIEAVSQKARILGVFSADDSMESALQKLSESLREIFSTTSSGVLFPFADDQCFKGQIFGRALSNGSPRVLTAEIGQSSPLGSLLREQEYLIINTQEALPQNEQWLKAGEIKNLFLQSLSDQQQKKVGVLVLANKDSDFGPWDQERVGILQDAVSKVLTNLLQCEGYRKVDSLRRQYCRELFGLLEDPLNHIKAEVQSIFSRLGKLTPYYKEHCEQILFEVGRLYEIAHEASSLEGFSQDSRRDKGFPDS
ncbi:MAG TPA: hypothetical protein VMW38_17760 [Terriglobia bacterium]|nr:hypothetical protein [Terriglobia bacterium]